MSRAARAPLLVTLLLCLAGADADASARDGVRPPPIGAEAGILEDARSGDVLAARSPDERRPIASATKLMTALLTLERAELDEVVVAAPYEGSPVESQIGLREGERMTVRDLLTALLLESANDAAITLADAISGSEPSFVEDMNRRARELGLNDTRYANPIGFDDPGNYSSARDLAELTRVLMRDRRFAAIVARPTVRLESGARRRVLANRNELVGRDPQIDGVKTGHTSAAGYVLIGSATGRGARVVSVVLGAASETARDEVSRELLEFGLDQFRRKSVLRPGRAVASVDVKYRDGERTTLTTRDDVRLTVRRGGGELRTRVVAPDELEGPLPAGSRVGSVEVVYGGEVVETVPLVTASAVPEAGTLERVTSGLGGPLTWIALAAIVLASAVALVRLGAASLRRSAR